MKPLSILTTCLAAFVPFAPLVSADQVIEGSSLESCQDNNALAASLFQVAFTPSNNTISFNINGVVSVSGKVMVEISVLAYGLEVVKKSLDPCKYKIDSFCNLKSGSTISRNWNTQGKDLGDLTKSIPSVAYTVPDIDLVIRIRLISQKSKRSVACVQTPLSNGKTVYHSAVGWVTAVVAGLGLLASAITSGLGHSNTAVHVASNALSLFGFFQTQAMIGMTAIPLPPIVQSWTQNFQWSMGIIRIGFLQRLATWYQRATGGTADQLLHQLDSTSVQVLKRSTDMTTTAARHAARIAARASHVARASQQGHDSGQKFTQATVRGITRVGFRARMPSTNIFLTAFIFYIVFVAAVIGLVVIFKGYCELATKKGWLNNGKFQEFRRNWKDVLRGICYRLSLLGYPQMSVLCLWEFTHHDSPAEIVLAVFMFIALTGSLGWASYKAIILANQSVNLHKNPAYILYSDPTALNKWGFLYVQFRATAYYFFIPILAYTLIKSMFIGLSQNAQVVQAIALFIMDICMLIAVAVLRPYMDRKTNALNIAICSVNFVNVLLLLFFSRIFHQPGIVTGVMGVIFFILNVIFAFVLLVLLLIASIYAVVSKNPEQRYQPMRDDRGSFMKTQPEMTTELDALGATARSEGKTLDEDDPSLSSMKQAPYTVTAGQFTRQPSRSPSVQPSAPLFPNENAGYGPDALRSYNASPVPRNFSSSPLYPTNPPAQYPAYRGQTSASPWQRGAGYDHF